MNDFDQFKAIVGQGREVPVKTPNGEMIITVQGVGLTDIVYLLERHYSAISDAFDELQSAGDEVRASIDVARKLLNEAPGLVADFVGLATGGMPGSTFQAAPFGVQLDLTMAAFEMTVPDGESLGKLVGLVRNMFGATGMPAAAP